MELRKSRLELQIVKVTDFAIDRWKRLEPVVINLRAKHGIFQQILSQLEKVSGLIGQLVKVRMKSPGREGRR